MGSKWLAARGVIAYIGPDFQEERRVQADIERKLAEATALQRRGDLAAAAAIYRQILKIERRLAPAHYNLALIQKEEGKALAAEKSFRAAIAADPAYKLAWRGLARFLCEKEKFREAVRAGLKLAALDDFAPPALQELADLLERMPVGDLGPAGDEAMLRCLNTDEVESDRFILTLLARINRQAGIRKMASGAEALGVLTGAFNEPVIAAAFSKLILPSAEIGEWISAARSSILAGDAFPSFEVIALLALQLALGEYALEPPNGEPPVVTDLESALIAALYGRIEPEIADEILEKGEDLLEALPWCRLLLIRMGPQQLREWQLRGTLPCLSSSDDAVSNAVREQYEESPYPRWRGLRSGGETTLPALLKSLFPGTAFAALPDRPKVLIAGCGTGRHALRTARRITGSKVTAIDLSRTSLAYGARQAEALGIDNVSFAEADLVALPGTLGRFDLIEACGVLHHMADPEAAWQGLIDHLTPAGVMKVALYSEEARQDVAAVRAMVGEERMETLTLDDIRRLRSDILALPDDHPAKGVTKELDFYSLSGCRDLLFHRHEQRFDIPRIKAAIETLGLEFLGFEFTESRVKKAYRARHKDDPAGRNLGNWAAVEAEHPALFRGMYQFWCRRRK